MAQGRIEFVVSAEVDTGDDTPMEAVLDELVAATQAVLSKEVIMIETPEMIDVSSPRIEEIREAVS